MRGRGQRETLHRERIVVPCDLVAILFARRKGLELGDCGDDVEKTIRTRRGPALADLYDDNE
jgi:hypothetical protein